MWTNVFFNALSIHGESDSSVLIKMPNSSKYNGWYFWHPKKLVREQGGKGYHLTFSFHNNWEFKILLYGKGRYNKRDVLKTEILTSSDMKRIFNVVDDHVNESVVLETEKIIQTETTETTIKIHTPEKIYPVGSNTIKDLKK